VTDDDEKLLRQSQAGDAAAIERLVHRHLPGLRAFLRLRMDPDIRAREACPDLAQSVCREVFAHLDRFEYLGEKAFKSWLYTTALNKLRQKQRYHRAQRRDVHREAGAADDRTDADLLGRYASFYTPSRDAAAREELARVERAFDEMPDAYREVVTLSRIVGLSSEEIAERTSRTPAAVRGLLHRALLRLATLLDSPPPTGSG